MYHPPLPCTQHVPTSDDFAVNGVQAAIDVLSVPDAPTIVVPASPAVREDGDLEIRGLGVYDADVSKLGDESLTFYISLEAICGRLSLNGSSVRQKTLSENEQDFVIASDAMFMVLRGGDSNGAELTTRTCLFLPRATSFGSFYERQAFRSLNVFRRFIFHSVFSMPSENILRPDRGRSPDFN